MIYDIMNEQCGDKLQNAVSEDLKFRLPAIEKPLAKIFNYALN